MLEVTVYYLQMFAHNGRYVLAPRAGLSVVRAVEPTVRYYRFLYNAVGEEYRWLSRRKMPDDTLSGVIRDPRCEVQVLYVDGTPAGFAELDRRKPDDIELVQFGLMREFLGQGLGRWFIQWVVDRVWSYQPRRFWLHTCTLDHPAALPNYHKAGLQLYKEEVIQREN